MRIVVAMMSHRRDNAMFRGLGRLVGLTCAGWLVACAPTPQPLPGARTPEAA